MRSAVPQSWWTAWEVLLLALTIWREAAGEPADGKIAVAYCYLDRVHHPKWWGNNLIEVLTKKWQVSSLTAPGDPMLVKWPRYGDPVFEECIEIAQGVLVGYFRNPVPGADSYFATTLDEPPLWAMKIVAGQVPGASMIGTIGRHRFFNTDGSHPENTSAGTA